jgi:hypothetical protein
VIGVLVVAAALCALAPAGAQASWQAIDYAEGGWSALTGTVSFAYSQPAAGACPSAWYQPPSLTQTLHESSTAQAVVNFLPQGNGKYVGPLTVTVDGTEKCWWNGSGEWVPITVTISGTDRLGNTFSCSGLSGVWFRAEWSRDVDYYSVTTGGGTCSVDGVKLPGTAYSFETGTYAQTASSGDGPTSGNLTGMLQISDY